MTCIFLFREEDATVGAIMNMTDLGRDLIMSATMLAPSVQWLRPVEVVGECRFTLVRGIIYISFPENQHISLDPSSLSHVLLRHVLLSYSLAFSFLLLLFPLDPNHRYLMKTYISC